MTVRSKGLELLQDMQAARTAEETEVTHEKGPPGLLQKVAGPRDKSV